LCGGSAGKVKGGIWSGEKFEVKGGNVDKVTGRNLRTDKEGGERNFAAVQTND
jgi:hypothetical protein